MDPSRGLSFPEEWTNMWKNMKKRRICLSRREGNWFRHGETPSRQNKGDNQVHNEILSPRCSYQLTKRSGMIFLPSIASSKDPCHGESRRSWQRRHDIWFSSRRWRARLIGIHCYSRHALISKKKNAGRWSNKEWLDVFQRESDQKSFQYCLNSDGLMIDLCAIQGHSWGTKIDLAILDKREIPYRWSEYLYHVGCSGYCIPFFNQDWLQEEKMQKKEGKQGRQTVFLTTLDPDEHWAIWGGRGVPRFVESTTGTMQKKMENNPGCNLLD